MLEYRSTSRVVVQVTVQPPETLQNDFRKQQGRGPSHLFAVPCCPHVDSYRSHHRHSVFSTSTRCQASGFSAGCEVPKSEVQSPAEASTWIFFKPMKTAGLFFAKCPMRFGLNKVAPFCILRRALRRSHPVAPRGCCREHARAQTARPAFPTHAPCQELQRAVDSVAFKHCP